MTLTLDGEGMDSANGIDYSRAAGAMEFEFRAYYADDRKPVVITNYVTEHGKDNVVTKVVKRVIPKTVTEQLVPLANGVRTGDPLTVTVSAGVLVAGIVIVGIAVKKERWSVSHEKSKKNNYRLSYGFYLHGDGASNDNGESFGGERSGGKKNVYSDIPCGKCCKF